MGRLRRKRKLFVKLDEESDDSDFGFNDIDGDVDASLDWDPSEFAEVKDEPIVEDFEVKEEPIYLQNQKQRPSQQLPKPASIWFRGENSKFTFFFLHKVRQAAFLKKATENETNGPRIRVTLEFARETDCLTAFRNVCRVRNFETVGSKAVFFGGMIYHDTLSRNKTPPVEKSDST